MANLWYLILSIFAAILSSLVLSFCAWICGCWEDDQDDMDHSRSVYINSKYQMDLESGSSETDAKKSSVSKKEEEVKKLKEKVSDIVHQEDKTKQAKLNFRKTRKFKDAVHLAYEMEKLKTKPSLLQLTKTLRRKEETRSPNHIPKCCHGNVAKDCYFCIMDEDNNGFTYHERPQSTPRKPIQRKLLSLTS